MTEKVVYFLGAGFSAPLGLPVMSDFLLRSKDLYFADMDSYKHFGPVLETIERMAKAKNYYTLDLFNIEEILSLVEMEDYVGTSRRKRAYQVYLRDVVSALTPAFTHRDQHDSWNGFQLSFAEHASAYAAFVASLFGVRWQRSSVDQTRFTSTKVGISGQYSIVTLNYDMVLENSLALLGAVVCPTEPLRFAPSLEQAEAGTVPLAKLHGSVEPLSIVPPTWNKVASNKNVKEAWRMAYSLLSDATQIRFIGYSLPPSDIYVRYLLSSSVLSSRHLKKIDAICLDPTSVVEKRYRNIISYYNFRFKNGNVTALLTANHRRASGAEQKDRDWRSVTFDKLEAIHEEYMTAP